MKEGLTIAELANQASLPSSTIRYYEKQGLLLPRGRTRSNYRFYGEDSIERLHFIKAAQEAGFTIEDIQKILAVKDGSHGHCGEVRDLIEERKGKIEERLADLRRAYDTLEHFMEICHPVERSGDCPAIDELETTSGD